MNGRGKHLVYLIMKTQDIIILSQLPGMTQPRLRLVIPWSQALPYMDKSALKQLAEHHRWLIAPQVEALQQAKNKAQAIIALHQKQGIHTLSVLDEKYPKALSSIKSPPTLLYLKGNMSLLDSLKTKHSRHRLTKCSAPHPASRQDHHPLSATGG